ncbi:hypothetical protein GCM10022249_02530 [Enteractinococcus coprophilus]
MSETFDVNRSATLTLSADTTAALHPGQPAGKNVQQGRFATTIFTDNADSGRWRHREMDVVQNRVATKCHIDGVEGNLGARMRQMVRFERHKKS